MGMGFGAGVCWLSLNVVSAVHRIGLDIVGSVGYVLAGLWFRELILLSCCG